MSTMRRIAARTTLEQAGHPVRFFPSASRQRLAAALTAGALALGVVGSGAVSGTAAVVTGQAASAAPAGLVSAADSDELKKKKKDVGKKIDGAEDDLEEASSGLRRAVNQLDRARAALNEARAELTVVRDKLRDARSRDALMQDRLDAAEARLNRARTDLASGVRDLARQQDQVKDSMIDSYLDGPAELDAIMGLLTDGSAEDVARQQAAAEAMVGHQTRMYDELDAAAVLLGVREEQVSAAREEVAAQREAAADHLSTVTSLEAQAEAARDRVASTVSARISAKQRAATVKQRDLRTLRRLKARERRLQGRIERAAQRSGTNVRARASGYLTRPVPGAVTSPFGYRIHPIYGYWGLHDGTDFGVYCGEPMRAAGSGTVIAKYYSSVYGNRLYLSLGKVNGRSLTVVYNHAQGYRYDVGDYVQRGNVVGRAGTTGWSTGCHLHFTVLVDGTAVDPMNWLS
ncbi:peptidoglycan DD-metalloendopeptidase family protein [Nocardioides bruguierae]|uniref:Peptidoglycan DD-metalloendopeptidase family protein n=1 Tax=Nocardioides bruguierae TaxID=2945102 RepID=A0A9X2IFJ1_9ACTN|nr:peptidoglycan DD-metalloendopeptidase family protein [Nocardioides bruguierae]MCM0620499.1 peptidoglycan DD-metalloendopeptidase family protein [Nocardioides bruguierae]